MQEEKQMSLLDEARVEINDVDSQLVKLFERRMKAVEGVIKYKMENNLPIFDAAREAANIARTTGMIENEELKSYFEDWYTYTMKVSKDYQQAILDANKEEK